MSEHTPGPWTFMEDEIFWGEIRGPNFELIAVMPELDERSEDFRLIAAAPELLEALELFMTWLKQYHTLTATINADAPEQLLKFNAVFHKVRQAIAKAKGNDGK